jgi:hypothetical protein
MSTMQNLVKYILDLLRLDTNDHNILIFKRYLTNKNIIVDNRR